jgi:hypothetical protein
MVPWATLETEQPTLAEAGRGLLYQHGPGLAYLATVRADGAPRLHPICPTLVDGHLYAAILRTSPKCHDLVRDGRYALHTFPRPDADDEFSLAGRAQQTDAAGVAACEAGLARDGVNSGDHTVFEFAIERALWSKYDGRSWPPSYTRWRAP